MPVETHYDALEVSRHASPEVIRAAYKSLMQRFHPDRNPLDGVAATRTARIASAYAVLSDPAKKALYDESLQVGPGLATAASVTPDPVYRTAMRPTPKRASANRSGRWVAVCIAVLVTVIAIVAVKFGGAERQQPQAELEKIRTSMAADTTPESARRALYSRKLEILDSHPELLRKSSEERVENMAARTFSLLEKPLVVWVAGGRTPGVSPVELTIPSISLFVGSFDAPNLLEHMDRHRERLARELAGLLANEDPALLRSAQAEQHLASVVTRAVSVSLGVQTTRGDYPSTYFESPGRYGVTHVLFPDRFTLAQSRP